MTIALLILSTAALAWAYAKYPEKFNETLVEIIRWGIVALAWHQIGGLLGFLPAFLIAQSTYTPVYNYFVGRDIWFTEDDTWYGKLVIKYLGNVSGRVLFIGQLLIGIALLIIL